MTRSKRLAPVGEVLEGTERECATRLASMQKRVAEAEQRCSELKRYLGEYQQMFHQRASVGIGVTGLRDYQTFIARLTDAVRQQEEQTAGLRSECERARLRWIEAAARKNAVNKVIAKAKNEDQKIEDRRLQKEMDERAQRPHSTHR